MEVLMRRGIVLSVGLLVGCAGSEVAPLSRGIPRAVEGTRADPVVFLPASELARRIRTRELRSEAVVAAFVRQIARHDGALGAVVLLDEAGALARAREADAAADRGEHWGPLHGVPVTVKDSFETKGLRTTAGSPALRDYVPATDAAVVELLRRAGAIVLAKTNLPTLAMDMQTYNPLFGTTKNPFDPSRTVGGSSGGCATALAMGMTPLSVGSDLAGSLRVPPAFVGVYGLKPTRGVVSLQGHVPPRPGELDGIRAMAVAGPLARTVEDLELALEVLARPSDRDPAPLPLRPLESPPASLRGLRIAWTTELDGAPVAREVSSALRAAVQVLARAGAVVTEARPEGFSTWRTWETWGALVGAQGGYDRSNAERWLGRLFVGGAVRDIPHQRRILDPIGVPSYMAALEEQRREARALDGFLGAHDAWLVPTASTVAFPHHAPSRTFGDFAVYDEPLVVDGEKVPYYVATQAWTTLFSVTESPVVALPVGLAPSGLPVGAQLVGRRFEDRRLLAVAKLVAAVLPRPRPPIAEEPAPAVAP
jgi:amidase